MFVVSQGRYNLRDSRISLRSIFDRAWMNGDPRLWNMVLAVDIMNACAMDNFKTRDKT